MKPKPTKKAPVIRRHNKYRPYVKSTNKELADRIATVENLLRHNPIKHNAARKWISNKFNVHRRTAELYIAQARENLLKCLKRTKEDWRCDSMALYQGIINSKSSTTKERLFAQKRIDELLGLCIPVTQKIEHSGELTNKVQNSATIDELGLTLEEKKKLLKKLREKQKKEQPDNSQLLPFPLSAVG